MMEYILAVLVGYFIGSIPTAYLVLKMHSGKDIRTLGSGNVGTFNSYEVTNSKLIGIIVLIIDLVKGILSVLIVKLILGDLYLLLITSLLSAVFGHCYSIWLKFKGGRGLATAAGGAIVLSPLILLFWILAWFVIKKWKKDIHLANSAASFAIIVICFLFGDFLNNYTYPPATGDFIFTFSISLLMVIILTKHIEPLYKMLRKQN